MSWILSVVGVILLSVLTDVLLPEGQTNKYIKGVFALLLVFIIITPVVNFFKSGVSLSSFLNFDAPHGEVVTEQSNEIEETENQITQSLKLFGINCTKTVIFSADDNINTVACVNVYLSDKAEEKVCDTVKRTVKSVVNVDAEDITIYGAG